MKSALLVLVVLFASLLTYGQADPKVTPAPTPPAQTTPVQPTPQKVQPIIEAGGLDNLCQAGLNHEYKLNDDHTFGTNDPNESLALSNASACIGYVTGWAHAISGAYIMENNKLWYVEINDQFNAVAAANLLHAFLQANPDARTVPSPLVLLEVAVNAGIAQVSPVEFRGQPNQPQNNERSPAETLKSTT